VFLYLANGRLFVRRDSGDIDEADASERFAACLLLALHEGGTLDPARGPQRDEAAPVPIARNRGRCTRGRVTRGGNEAVTRDVGPSQP
jgi:hypothetical protein